MDSLGDPYAVLGVEPDADESAVRERYRSLLKDSHPDQGGSREAFLRVRRPTQAVMSGYRGRTADGGAATAGFGASNGIDEVPF